MEKLIIIILFAFFAVSCLNQETKEDKTPQRYYYKHIYRTGDELQEEYIGAYTIRDISWSGDSMFVEITEYTSSFEIRKVENETFIIKNGEVYSVKKNGTRLYLSTSTSECVDYLPNSHSLSGVYGKRHCFLEKDMTNDDDTLYKFRVNAGLAKVFDDENRPYWVNNGPLYLFCYDKDFVLFSVEYIGSLNRYLRTERMEPLLSNVPRWNFLHEQLKTKIRKYDNKKLKNGKQ